MLAAQLRDVTRELEQGMSLGQGWRREVTLEGRCAGQAERRENSIDSNIRSKLWREMKKSTSGKVISTRERGVEQVAMR